MTFGDTYSRSDLGGYDDFSKELVYDLRATYAKILDEVLTRIATCRIEKDFDGWFGALDDLHTEVNQKLDLKEREEYIKRLKKCVIVLNQFSEAYKGTSKNPEECFQVKTALKELEMWLKIKMEKHKMFGSKPQMEGLS